MNTQQLECFVHVADKLNFTKAAEELHISTPAVTHHIKNLEEELGTTLFLRNSKMVKLTETGALFYGEARDILQKLDMAEKKVRQLASQKLTVLRIGCSSQAELAALEQPFAKLRDEFPTVYPQIIIQDYSILKSMLVNKQLDVMIGTKEMTPESRDYVFRKIKHVRSYAIVEEHSPLAASKKIHYKDLADEPLIAIHPRLIPLNYSNQLQQFITLHAQKHFHILCEHDQSAVLLAKCGYGTAILPEFYLPAHTEGIVILPFADEQAEIEYGIAYPKNLRDRHVRQFIRYFEQSHPSPPCPEGHTPPRI